MQLVQRSIAIQFLKHLSIHLPIEERATLSNQPYGILWYSLSPGQQKAERALSLQNVTVLPFLALDIYRNCPVIDDVFAHERVSGYVIVAYGYRTCLTVVNGCLSTGLLSYSCSRTQ